MDAPAIPNDTHILPRMKKIRRIACRLAVVFFAAAAGPAHAAPADRPNVVLIMADDIGYECFSSYGGADYRTPHLDRMAAGGLRFAHAHAQPLCTPSRVQIMTGQYNVRNYTRFGHLDPTERTFGNDMRDAGYATAIGGKWQLGGDRESVVRRGFDEYCLWWMDRKSWRYGNVGELVRNGETLPGGRGEYGPDVVNAFILDFIERHAREPFFVYYPMMLPHAPFVPTPLSTGAGGPREEDPRYFADMVEYMDLLVGRVISKLDELGLRENTLVIFLADNGTNTGIASRMIDGTIARGGKGRTTDAGTHVPMIVSWPGTTPAGFVSETLVDFSDIAPTLRALAGFAPGPDRPLDGFNLLPVLKGEKPGEREWSYCWYAKEGREGEVAIFARTVRYKLYRDGRFFDLARDRLEENPLDINELPPEAAAARGSLREIIERHATTEADRSL